VDRFYAQAKPPERYRKGSISTLYFFVFQLNAQGRRLIKNFEDESAETESAETKEERAF